MGYELVFQDTYILELRPPCQYNLDSLSKYKLAANSPGFMSAIAFTAASLSAWAGGGSGGEPRAALSDQK